MKLLNNIYSIGFIFFSTIVLLSALMNSITKDYYWLILTIPLFILSIIGIKAGIDLWKERSNGLEIMFGFLSFVVSLNIINIVWGTVSNKDSLILNNAKDLLITIPLTVGLFVIWKNKLTPRNSKTRNILIGVGFGAALFLIIARNTILLETFTSH